MTVRFAKNVVLRTTAVGIERACRIGLALLIARAFGAASFGRYQFVATLIAVFALATDLGVGTWATATVARNPSAAIRTATAALRVRLYMAVPYAAAASVFAMWAPNAETRWLILFVGVQGFASSVVDLGGALLRGAGYFRDDAVVAIGRAVLLMVFGGVSIACSGSLAVLCASLAGAAVLSAAHSLFVVIQHNVVDASRAAPVEPSGSLRVIRESAPIGVAALIALLYSRADTLLIRTLLDDAAVGLYSAAYKAFESAMIVPSVLLAVVLPALARVHDEPSRRSSLEGRTVTALLIAGGVFGVGVGVWADRIVLLCFGAEFEAAVAVLRRLAVVIPLLYLNFAFLHFLIARGLSRSAPWIALTMLAVNIVSNLWFIPRLGLVGAANAALASEVAGCLACLSVLYLRGHPGRSTHVTDNANRSGRYDVYVPTRWRWLLRRASR